VGAVGSLGKVESGGGSLVLGTLCTQPMANVRGAPAERFEKHGVTKLINYFMISFGLRFTFSFEHARCGQRFEENVEEGKALEFKALNQLLPFLFSTDHGILVRRFPTLSIL
jgi:hypothetical protein